MGRKLGSENVQFPRHLLMATSSTERENKNDGPELEEDCNEKLRDPEDEEPELAPLWVCGWVAEADGHGCDYGDSRTKGFRNREL